MQDQHCISTRLGRQTRLALALALGLGVSGAMAAAPNPTLSNYLDNATQLTRAVLSGEVERPAFMALSTQTTHAVTANTWQVTSCDDAGPGSLRDVVASWAQPGDTVDLSGLDCDIILQSSIITSKDDLTLKGNPDNKYAVLGRNAVTPLIHNGTGTLTLDGLTVSFGRFELNSSSIASGGCIYSQGKVVLKNRSEVKYCNAVNNGSGMAKGGGIYARSSVTLEESVVSGNKAIALNANALGGGIYAGGAVKMEGGMVSNNVVSGHLFGSGGGIFTGGGLQTKYAMIGDNVAKATGTPSLASSAGGGVAIKQGAISTIKYSTVYDNRAGHGAGMLIGSGAMPPTTGTTVIQHSTIANNKSLATTEFGGGALTLMQPTTISNSTISGNTEKNSADQKYGAGIMMRSGVDLTLNSTIVSGNLLLRSDGIESPDDLYANGSSAPTIAGDHNLIGLIRNALSPSDTISSAVPELGPLQDNGGYTLTMAVLPGSDAIDTGASNGFSKDQRGTGFLRSVGIAPDIGAFEMAGDRIFANGFD